MNVSSHEVTIEFEDTTRTREPFAGPAKVDTPAAIDRAIDGTLVRMVRDSGARTNEEVTRTRELSSERTHRFRSSTRFSPEYFQMDTLVHSLTATFAGAGVAAAFLKFARDIIIAWLNNRSMRSVTVKVGTKTIKLSGVNDVEEACKALQELKRTSDSSTSKSKTKKSTSKEKGRRKKAKAKK